MRAVPPPGFPVQHRTGVATLGPEVVDQRPGFVLICDGSHPGDHRWPFDAASRVLPETDAAE
jgi:hypothetical protein